MIARRDGDGHLYDQEAVAVDNRVSARTVRRRCEQVACDVSSRAPLYDADTASAVLGAVRPRPARSAPAQRAKVAVLRLA